MKIFFGCDHAGWSLKGELIKVSEDLGYDVEDFGAYSEKNCDYALIAHPVCEAVSREAAPGVLICGTGIGMSMAANRHKTIRAALCATEIHARFARMHNDANVLCLGARVTGSALARAILETFLATNFEGGRHQRRIEQLDPSD